VAGSVPGFVASPFEGDLGGLQEEREVVWHGMVEADVTLGETLDTHKDELQYER